MKEMDRRLALTLLSGLIGKSESPSKECVFCSESIVNIVIDIQRGLKMDCCAECKYWDPRGDKTGFCRREVALHIGTNCPITSHTDTCEEFSQREPNQDDEYPS